MYNRYIPQPDGSYRRSRMPDTAGQTQQRATPAPVPEPSSQPCIPEEEKPPCRERTQPQQFCPKRRQRMVASSKKPNNLEPKGIPITSFLKQLLPGDFDTSDLLIVLLLLLMAGDCQEDQNSALLTLVLYLFL